MPKDEFNIEKMARLAHIRLSKEEQDRLKGDIQKILVYVEQLNELDIDDVEPTSHVLNVTNVFREDTVRKSDTIEKVLRHAPDVARPYFRVPKVIEGTG